MMESIGCVKIGEGCCVLRSVQKASLRVRFVRVAVEATRDPRRLFA
jgi:hypothetical protein